MTTGRRSHIGAGKPPIIVAHFETLDSLVEALRAKLGVHTGTRSLADLGGGSLVWREIPVSSRWSTSWPGESATTATAFVETAVARFPASAA